MNPGGICTPLEQIVAGEWEPCETVARVPVLCPDSGDPGPCPNGCPDPDPCANGCPDPNPCPNGCQPPPIPDPVELCGEHCEDPGPGPGPSPCLAPSCLPPVEPPPCGSLCEVPDPGECNLPNHVRAIVCDGELPDPADPCTSLPNGCEVPDPCTGNHCTVPDRQAREACQRAFDLVSSSRPPLPTDPMAGGGTQDCDPIFDLPGQVCAALGQACAGVSAGPAFSIRWTQPWADRPMQVEVTVLSVMCVQAQDGGAAPVVGSPAAADASTCTPHPLLASLGV